MTYYRNYQYGSGVGRVFVGAPYQQGAGIGSFLGGVFRYVLPLLKRSAKAVGKEALQAGVNIMADVGERKTPFKEALKSRMRQSGENLKERAKENLDRFMSGEGYKVKLSGMPPHLAIALAKRRKGRKKTARKDRKKKKVGRLSRKRASKKSRRKNKAKKKRVNSDFVDIFK